MLTTAVSQTSVLGEKRDLTDFAVMNLSHVITEFSFGPYFPDIAQPLDNSFELTHERKLTKCRLLVITLTWMPAFIAYQYFLHVVPTTYVAPRSQPLRTNQYSVTHYTRQVDHGRGTPGIFFKFELDPLNIAIHQRTTTFGQFFIRLLPFSDVRFITYPLSPQVYRCCRGDLRLRVLRCSCGCESH